MTEKSATTAPPCARRGRRPRRAPRGSGESPHLAASSSAATQPAERATPPPSRPAARPCRRTALAAARLEIGGEGEGVAARVRIRKICCQEYSQVICVVLGLQAWLSLLTSELTMIAGMAVGFNIVFEHDDLITAICFASVVVSLLPYTLSRLDKKVAGIFNACIAGFTLLCFVLGLLISHPHTPVNMNVMFPKLSGESAYSLMALLGTNIIVRNFYTHSAFVQISYVQVQRRSSVHTLGSLFHDHLFSILFIFTGIFLVNYILLSSAADESSDTLVMNFQDAMEVMHQVQLEELALMWRILLVDTDGSVYRFR
ncbi:protein ETHYLENE-INSENSITIVE 2-like [Miscanthus floridulus]|uniref:protein ETHYLENE-INSENSITIVE 2-like n=1 Tax=Miscanthus floridulus TaxID=154761 RepID=UPI0034589D6F